MKMKKLYNSTKELSEAIGYKQNHKIRKSEITHKVKYFFTDKLSRLKDKFFSSLFFLIKAYFAIGRGL